MTLVDTHMLEKRVSELEARILEGEYNTKQFVQSESKKNWKIQPQAETFFGLYTALCIDTIDPWKQNRVRFFSPLYHKPDTPIKALPWANPISSMGGFDSCGLSWVPPAGTTLCILFENGSRQTPYYIGTTWHRDRGPDGGHIWNYNIDEYYKIHEGHRKGYYVGPDDGSQVLPPWNTENYNGKDIDSIAEFENDPEAQQKITYPNIYGFKTPQKHMMKMVDGNYKCNHKYKRIEILSSGGNWMCMKDDHIHDATWVHPDCQDGPDTTTCNTADGEPIEELECSGSSSNSSIQSGHPSTPDGTTYGLDSNEGSNQYFKDKNECRPIAGPGTPQNNKCELPQSGIQFLSGAGHSFVMDDSVEEPRGKPEWERVLEPFDFGCNDLFLGKTFWVSATGHRIEMSDVEDGEAGLRGEENYIRMLTAAGNKIELNDHSKSKTLAGNKRGITMQSTSNHTIEMIDEDNEQIVPERRDGGVPTPKATKAFVKIRTGYGLEISLNDDNSQDETQTQNIQIFAPQKDNTVRGPHIMRYQERPNGPGQVFLRVGGDYICSTYDSHYTVVGDVEQNPADKLTSVSRNTIIATEEFYYNVADLHAFVADQVILLMAGKDCRPQDPDADGCAPCVWPVLCLSPKGITISDRVFASASSSAACASIYHLLPFHNCDPFEGC